MELSDQITRMRMLVLNYTVRLFPEACFFRSTRVTYTILIYTFGYNILYTKRIMASLNHWVDIIKKYIGITFMTNCVFCFTFKKTRTHIIVFYIIYKQYLMVIWHVYT